MNCIQIIKQKLVHYTWDLAYFPYEEGILNEGLNLRELHYVKNPYKNKWFADPFILDDNAEELIILVEEFDSAIKKGRIAKLSINKHSDTITSCDIILELPTHLSFPAIYRENGNIYVHPENSASGASYIYRFDRKENKLIDPVCILNEPITDAIILHEGERYYMFATCLPDPNGDILYCYTAHNLLGPYQYFGKEMYPHCKGRMAGGFLYKSNSVIRPAQDCSGSYGKAVIFYEGHKSVCTIKPNKLKYAGIHTFNVYRDIGIIDLKSNDFPFLVYINNLLKEIK